ncbi:MAG: fumarylacetoacetase [Candidatus Eremiobacteraeota bacterium]|nr:fumarylacetoacetase [Candidatus Eremiobacteraeota bacterium]
MRSWVSIPPGSDFPLENLPYGIFSPPGGAPRVGVALGDSVIDLARLGEAGLLDGILADPTGTFSQPSLNAFLSLGRDAWQATRARLLSLLRDESSEIRDRAGLADELVAPQSEVRLHLPIAIGDYADFYSSIEHATNVGKIFRPGGEPLMPNYRWIPIAYNGRSSTVVASGTPIERPCGQTKSAPDAAPRFGPSRQLDYELELGFVTGPANPNGAAIPTGRAAEHIFGLVLLNDWSARDIQAWEGQPLGPFLSKSFATSISPWIVTLDALAPYRVPNRAQDPAPLEYLRVGEDWAFDVELTVELESAGMRARLLAPQTISRVNFRGMYWTMPQQLAHLTSNGTQIRPGDLYGSGTVSGSDEGTFGSLLELTRRGATPLTLADGSSRAFLEDGDTVIMRGVSERPGRPRIGFGEVRGTVV